MHNDCSDISSCVMPSCCENKRNALNMHLAALANLQQETDISGLENHRISNAIHFGFPNTIWFLACKTIWKKTKYTYADHRMSYSGKAAKIHTQKWITQSCTTANVTAAILVKEQARHGIDRPRPEIFEYRSYKIWFLFTVLWHRYTASMLLLWFVIMLHMDRSANLGHLSIWILCILWFHSCGLGRSIAVDDNVVLMSAEKVYKLLLWAI